MLAPDLSHNGVHLSLCRYARHSRTQPSDGDHISAAAEHSVSSHRSPEIGCGVVSKGKFRQDSDDAVLLVVEDDGAAQNVWVSAELPLPEPRGHQSDRPLPRLIFLLREQPPHQWMHSQHSEKTRARFHNGNGVRLVPAAQDPSRRARAFD